MWEIALSEASGNAFVLDKIEKKMSRSMRGLSGVLARTERGSRAYLLLGCEDGAREYLEECLIYAIADAIITDYKHAYLTKNARFPITNEVNYKTFINALIAFDRECDREIALEKISLSENTMIDGIYNFRLQEIRLRWNEMLELASENSVYLSFEDTFIELVRFLINAVDSKADTVGVDVSGEGRVALDADGEPSDYGFEITAEELLPALIDLAPKHVRISRPENLPSKIRELLNQLYSDKIIYT